MPPDGDNDAIDALLHQVLREVPEAERLSVPSEYRPVRDLASRPKMLHDRCRKLPEVRHEMYVISVVSVLALDCGNIVELIVSSESLHAPQK